MPSTQGKYGFGPFTTRHTRGDRTLTPQAPHTIISQSEHRTLADLRRARAPRERLNDRCLSPLQRGPLFTIPQTEPHWFLSRSSTRSAQSPTETPVTIDSCLALGGGWGRGQGSGEGEGWGEGAGRKV